VIQAPQDIAAEEAFLGCVLIDEGVLDDIEILPQDFYKQIHGQIFSIMLKLRAKGTPIDFITLDKDIHDIAGLMALMDKVVIHTRAPLYAQRIKDKAILRRIVQLGMEMIEATAIEENPRNILDDFEAEIMKIGENEKSSDFRKLSDNMIEHLTDLEKRVMQDEKPGIMTGFKALDKRLNGLHGGDLVILAARPGMGKTTLALNILTNLAEKGVVVAMLSLEMSEEALRTRIISSRARVDSSNVRGGNLSEGELHTYIVTAKAMHSLPIYINQDPRTSLLRLKSAARRLKRQKGVKLLIVDYLQLMTAGEKIEGRVQEVSHISRQMKLLAKALDIPIILLSQLNRSSEKEKKRSPRLSDLRDSGAIEQDADVVAFLYIKDEETNSTDTELLIRKNRSGPTGEDWLEFEKIYNLFTERGM